MNAGPLTEADGVTCHLRKEHLFAAMYGPEADTVWVISPDGGGYTMRPASEREVNALGRSARLRVVYRAPHRRGTTKVTMTTTVSTGHSIFPGFSNDAEIEKQPGLTVTSEAPAGQGPGKGRSFVLSFAKGATIELPDWLAKRMLDLGFATAAVRRTKSRIARSFWRKT